MKSSKEKSVQVLTASAALLVLLLLPLTGCSEGGSEKAPDRGSVDVPPIYVAQTLVMKESGEPVVERNYLQLLKACHDAGVATTPLDESDVKKLGRTYYQLWFDDKHSAWQEDAWNFSVGEDSSKPCQFRIKHETNKVVDSAKGHLSIDMVNGTAVNEADTGFLAGGSADPNDDEKLDDASAEQAGFQRLGYATDAGQRCLRWRAPKPNDGEGCTWSEGRKWGFSSAANLDQAASYNPGDIVLWVHPANGTGGELTTQKMTVGAAAFDDAVFAPPAGVSVKEEKP